MHESVELEETTSWRQFHYCPQPIARPAQNIKQGNNN